MRKREREREREIKTFKNNIKGSKNPKKKGKT